MTDTTTIAVRREGKRIILTMTHHLRDQPGPKEAVDEFGLDAATAALLARDLLALAAEAGAA